MVFRAAILVTLIGLPCTGAASSLPPAKRAPKGQENLEEFFQAAKKKLFARKTKEGFDDFKALYRASISQHIPFYRMPAAYYLSSMYLAGNDVENAIKYGIECRDTAIEQKDIYYEILADDLLSQLYAKKEPVKNLLTALTYANEGAKLLKENPSLRERSPELQIVQKSRSDLISKMYTQANLDFLGNHYKEALDLYKATNEYTGAPQQAMGSSMALGYMYLNGWHVKKNEETAREYFIRAYKLSSKIPSMHSMAAYKIGLTYYQTGDQRLSDAKTALPYFRESYEIGPEHTNGGSALILGEIYMTDDGVEPDLQQAKRYFQEALKYKNDLEEDQVVYMSSYANLATLLFYDEHAYEQGIKNMHAAYKLARTRKDKETLAFRLTQMYRTLGGVLAMHLFSLLDHYTPEEAAQAKKTIRLMRSINHVTEPLNEFITLAEEKLEALAKAPPTKPLGEAEIRKQAETHKKENDDKRETLLKEFDTLLDTYTKQETVNLNQFHLAKKILLDIAQIGAPDSSTSRTLEKKFIALTAQRNKKQERVQKLLEEITNNINRFTDASFKRAESDIEQARRLSDDDKELSERVETAQQLLSEQQKLKAAREKPAPTAIEPETTEQASGRRSPIMAQKAGKVKKFLLSQGFTHEWTTGSHEQYRNPNGQATTIAYADSEEMPPAALIGLAKDIGMDVQKLNDALLKM